MFKYIFRTYVLCAFSIGVVAGSANVYASDINSEHSNEAHTPILVVTTFSILEDITNQIGGGKINVVSLITRKADAHTFEPSPKTVKNVSQADLLISNGLGFETWLDRVLQSSNFKGLHLVASTGVSALSFEHAHDHDHDDEGHDHEHAHQGLDPHAWQSLKNGIAYAENIVSALVQIDPVNADYYNNRADKYIREMQALDAELQLEIDGIKPENRNAITSHEAFAYFAKSYDVNFMATTGISTQAEPSAREIARLIDLTMTLGKVAFFVEFGTNPRMINQLAKELNAPVGGILYSDTLDEPNHEAGSYLGMMQWNVRRLTEALN